MLGTSLHEPDLISNRKKELNSLFFFAQDAVNYKGLIVCLLFGLIFFLFQTVKDYKLSTHILLV